MKISKGNSLDAERSVVRHGIIMAAISLILLLCSSCFVFAATEKDFELIPDYSLGSLEIKYKATGEHVCNIWIEGENVVPKIAVEGNDIYFTTYSQVGTYDYAKCTLRCFNIVDKEVIDLDLNLPGYYWQYQLDFVYDGSVYMTGIASSDYAGTYRYDMNGDYVKKISDGAIVYHYKQYVVCDPSPVLETFAPYSVYVYNAKTKKTKTVLGNIAKMSPNGKYLYLAKMKKNNSNPSRKKSSYTIVRYRLTNEKLKTLVETFKGYSLSKITSKYIYYVRNKGGKDLYYRYTIKTKERKKISFAEYEAVMAKKS